MYHPKTYNERKIQLELTNLAIGNHTLICDCPEQGFHTLKILTKQLAPELTKQQKKEIKKCLGGDEDDTHGDHNGEEEEIDFGEELEKLFNTVDTEEDAG